MRPGDAPAGGQLRRRALSDHQAAQRRASGGRKTVWVREGGRKRLVDRATGEVLVDLDVVGGTGWSGWREHDGEGRA